MRVDLSRLFSSFSKRTGPQIEPKSVLSAEFRNRVILLCRDNFYGPTFWEQILRNLQYLHGRQTLSRVASRNSLDDYILPRTAIGPSFEQQLLVVPTIRNRYGNAHGKGTNQEATPKHVAQFAINSTASAILLLVDETES